MDKFWLGFGAGLGTAYLLGLWATRCALPKGHHADHTCLCHAQGLSNG